MEISRLPKSAGAASLALVASAALAACSGGAGSPGAPVAGPLPAGNAAAAPDAQAQSGIPAGYGLVLDDNGNPTAVAKCTAPPPDPNASNVTLTGAAQTVTVPCFKDYTAVASVPASNAKGVVVKLEASNDKTLGAVANTRYGTPLVYTSLTPNKTVTFTNSKSVILTTVSSPSAIAAPHIYAMQVYVPSFHAAIQTVANIKPVTGTHEIRFNIAPPGGQFPAIQAVVIVYKTK